MKSSHLHILRNFGVLWMLNFASMLAKLIQKEHVQFIVLVGKMWRDQEMILRVVISAARHSPQNFCNGSWHSTWKLEFKDELQAVEIKGKLQVGAHYFEEGNVQLDANNECKDSTMMQDLRRKLPVTCTLFPWHNTLQFSLTRDITKELGIGK